MYELLDHSADAVSNALDGGAWIAILVAFVAYFIVSFLWWGPLFGRTWARYSGMDPDEKPDAATMTKAMTIQVIATFLTAFVVWHVLMAFNVIAEGGEAVVDDQLGIVMALQGAFWIWLGLFLPVQLGRAAWEKAPWGLVAINAGGQLVSLLVMAFVFTLL